MGNYKCLAVNNQIRRLDRHDSPKGFDSEYGRVASPLLPDGRMISLPIPDKDAPTAYESIRRDELTMVDLLIDLGAKRGKPAKPIARTDFADLDSDAVSRPSGWRAIFGQSGAALGHLPPSSTSASRRSLAEQGEVVQAAAEMSDLVVDEATSAQVAVPDLASICVEFAYSRKSPIGLAPSTHFERCRSLRQLRSIGCPTGSG